MSLTRRERRIIRKLRTIVFLFVVLIIGFTIANKGFNTSNPKETADLIARFIQNEYQEQLVLEGEVDVEAIIKLAKKLDNSGLIINYNAINDRVVILKALDNKYIVYHDLDLKK